MVKYLGEMSKKLKYAVIAVVLVSFMFFGIYSTIASRKAFVAKVDGIKITTQEFNKYLSNRKQQIFTNVQGDEARYNQAIAFVENPQFQQFALNEMINTLVISKFLKQYYTVYVHYNSQQILHQQELKSMLLFAKKDLSQNL